MQHRQRMNGQQLFILGTTLMLCLAAPSESRAGCGDYVTIGRSMSAQHSSEKEKVPQKHSTCHGASCHKKQQDFGLPIVPTTPKLRIEDTLARLDSVAPVKPHAVEWLIPLQESFPETEILLNIFHPPRTHSVQSC